MHRALNRLRTPTTALTLVGPSHSARVLEATASRAWLRRVSLQTSTHAGGAAFSSSHETIPESIENCGERGVSTSQTKITQQQHSSGAEPGHDPDKILAKSTAPTVDEASADSVPPGSRVVDQDISLANDAKALIAGLSEATALGDPGPALSKDTKSSPFLSLPRPISPQMFYSHLRFALSSKPPPDVEALIDWHDSHPHLHSLESYNTSIEFAITYGQYDIANRLFDDMTKSGIRYDSTTYKLLVRLHAGQFSKLGEDTSDRPILRKGSTSVVKLISVIRDPDPDISTEEFIKQILACLQPMFSGWEVHPKIVKAAVYSILRKGLFTPAVELVYTYFSMLPADITEEASAECLDIIHALLNVDTKRGSDSFYANRKLLVSLLETHSSFQPSSDTVLLLLLPLKRAKKSGAVALTFMKTFTRIWGSGVMDERVKQRMVKLVERESRLDIIEKMKS